MACQFEIEVGDVVEWARGYKGAPFHAMLCDPPYEIAFMGKKWDARGVAFERETWAALAEHLLPGGFLMAFGGSRTFHRLVAAIEDAGFIIHPSISWVFASGFPKATRIDSQIDKGAGVKGELIQHAQPDRGRAMDFGMTQGGALEYRAATEQAKIWSGHRYGLQALKPAAEFICVAQKPYAGKPFECIARSGAGALNIDAARLELPEGDPVINRQFAGSQGSCFGKFKSHTQKVVRDMTPDGGRWPGNFVLTHTPECGTDEVPFCAHGCPVSDLNAQAGTNAPGGDRNGEKFFHCSTWEPEITEAPFLYWPKASRTERAAGLETFPAIECRTGCGGEFPDEGGKQPEPRDRFKVVARNPHPCCKPIDLCRHLATLLLPPAAYAPRRLAIPFAGSGSESVGAMLAGWDQILGIEREADYAALARARLTFWSGVKPGSRPKPNKPEAGQISFNL